MKLAAIQMNSGTDVAENIAAATALIRDAAVQGATFIATPEMTHLLEKDANALRQSVRIWDEDLGVAAFSALATDLGVHLLIGSMAILREDGGIANRAVLSGPDGKTIATYDKINLFEAAISKSENYREADTYVAGDQSVMAEIENITLGLSICYDLRFPALYRNYARAEVDMIAVPAAFTVATGRAHWEVLLRARAIETGAYIIAPAQGGIHQDGRKTWGRSMIIGPWGEVVAALDHDAPGILLAEIDPAAITKARARIPAWSQL